MASCTALAMVRTASLVVCALGIGACDSAPQSQSSGADMALPAAGDLASPPDLAYPAGPYGVDVDSVLGDWAGKGYRFTPASMDPMTTPYEPIALSSFRSCR